MTKNNIVFDIYIQLNKMSDEYNAKENCEEYIKDKTIKILKIEKKIAFKEKRVRTNERKLGYCRDKRRKRRLEFSVFCCKKDLEDLYTDINSLKERRDAMKVALDTMFV